MISNKQWVVAFLGWALISGAAFATERYFAYTYEPEVFPQGAAEFEQWVSWRGQRTDAAGQHDYSRWEFREELEYGVTDNYSVSLYVNTSETSWQPVPATAEKAPGFVFDGISIENRYMVCNPAEHAIGLTLYLEPRFSGPEAELEEKIIIGQRIGDWKWALNLSHATEWALNDHTTEGEFEVNFGITRHLNKHWSVGIEVRDHNELPEYDQWENTAVFVGPSVTYTADKWWATLSVMPQVYGNNFQDNPDNNHGFDLEGHERINIRLIFGIGL